MNPFDATEPLNIVNPISPYNPNGVYYQNTQPAIHPSVETKGEKDAALVLLLFFFLALILMFRWALKTSK